MEQRSPEAKYQQNQTACGGQPEEQEAPCPGCQAVGGSEEGFLIQLKSLRADNEVWHTCY